MKIFKEILKSNGLHYNKETLNREIDMLYNKQMLEDFIDTKTEALFINKSLFKDREDIYLVYYFI